MLYHSKERLAFLDIFKALAIVLVVVGHIPVPLRNTAVTQWIYSFHMPAFFSVYGMSYNTDRHKQKGGGGLNKAFLRQKIKRLLVPCFAWGLIYSDFSAKNLLFIAYGSQASFVKASSLSSLWFLTCMFLSVCAFELIMQLVAGLHGTKSKVILLSSLAVALFLIGSILPHMKRGYPWCVDIVPIALGFIIVGYGFQHAIRSLETLNNGKPGIWLALMLTGILLSLLYIPNLKFISGNNVDMASRSLGSIVLYVPTAVGGILILTAAAALLNGRRFCNRIAALGAWSMPIFLLHKFPLITLSTYCSGKGLQSPWIGLLIAAVVFSLSYGAAHILKWFAPNLIGLNQS